MHKSKKSENLGLKIWDWDLIFVGAVKAISSPGVRSPWLHGYLLIQSAQKPEERESPLVSNAFTQWAIKAQNF